MGLETEYGVSCDVAMNADTAAGAICRSEAIPPCEFHNNSGARIYKDVGSHPEYCTPECDSNDIDELVAHVEAGHIYVARRATKFERTFKEQRAQEDGPMPQIPLNLYINNVCDVGGYNYEQSTFGAHENYQVETAKTLESFASPLIPYLVTRQLILGAGRQVRSYSGLEYELAQRSGFIQCVFSSASTQGRPIVNTRDERHSRTPGLKRLHLIVGDNCFTPEQTGLKFATMHGMLSLLEERRLKWVALCNPVQAIKAISQNPLYKVDLVGRKRPRTAREIQETYFDQLWQLVDSDSEWDSLRPWVARWGYHLDKLKLSLAAVATDFRWENLARPHLGELNWATKQVLLFDYQARKPTMSMGQLQGLELSMHQITGHRPVRQVILDRYSDQAQRLPAIQRALENPPATTRAFVRIWAWRHGFSATNWGIISARIGATSHTVYLDDTLDSEIPQILL